MGTLSSLVGNTPSWRWVWHLFISSPQEPPWYAWSFKGDRERPTPSAPPDASYLVPWIHVNPGTICIFNKGTVFKTLTLQIRHLRHDFVYLQKKKKKSYVLIWLSMSENVMNTYKPASTVVSVDALYRRHPSPWSMRSTQFPIHLFHLFFPCLWSLLLSLSIPKLGDFFFHIPYHTPTTPTNVASHTPTLKKAKMSFCYTAEMKVSL